MTKERGEGKGKGKGKKERGMESIKEICLSAN